MRFVAHKRVIVHHVHNDAYAVGVERLYHLLHLAYARCRVVRIGGIAAFGNIVILGIVAPIVEVGVEFRLVDGGVIVRRQNLYMRDAQFFQMVEAGFLTLRRGGAAF